MHASVFARIIPTDLPGPQDAANGNERAKMRRVGIIPDRWPVGFIVGLLVAGAGRSTDWDGAVLSASAASFPPDGFQDSGRRTLV